MRDCSPNPAYVGRFAPSPTGDLHFGSLTAALASYLQARTMNGQWLLRIEDLDPPREVAGSADRIIADLRRFGMEPDRAIMYQSCRREAYTLASTRLLDSGLAFYCSCSRKSLPASGIYPGTCRNGISPGIRKRNCAIRVKVAAQPIEFTDVVQGLQRQDLQTSCGDFVIRRADGLTAYQLAVVVDDAHQGVTEVVRGADLLDSTGRQIWLQQKLGLSTPGYLHLPVAALHDGSKLSKRLGSDPVRNLPPAAALRSALKFLGHEAPALSLAGTWQWALENWSPALIPRQQTRPWNAGLQQNQLRA